jgi:L-aminopeptidase/D-esterase-like protein
MDKPAQITNDNVDLTPRTSFKGPALALDFPALSVGVAEYDEGPTGCTVLVFDKRVLTAVDVRGGSPGVYMADAGGADAICFAGGSLLGLEACAGVAAEIFAQRGHPPGWEQIPCVQGAIIFDMGGPNSVYPDKELGRAAVRTARSGWFPLGARGAGRAARVGKGQGADMSEPCGQGAAFGEYGPTKIAVFCVVNAVGAMVDRRGAVVRGHRTPAGDRVRAEESIVARLANATSAPSTPRGNTTLTAVVTNQRLGQRELQQLGRQVHASMARCIQPFHTPYDGDVLFTVSTWEVTNDALAPEALGVLASELAWDAVLASYGP